MYTNELKVIEALLYYLDNKKDLSRIVNDVFYDKDEFDSCKINLFNIVCIKSILCSNPNFNMKDIDNIIDNIEIMRDNCLSNEEIYNNIISSLKEGNYIFDKDSNINIYNDKIDIIVSPTWLYDLASLSKNKTFNRVILFNKNEELDIIDEKSLLNYLYHTKIFLVNMKNGEDLDNIYRRALMNTKGLLIGKPSIKSYDIKNTFLRNIPTKIETNISKYDFTNYRTITSIINRYPNFYNLHLKEQKQIIERILSNSEATNTVDYLNLSKLILLTDTDNEDDIINQVDINECYIALFKVYIYLLDIMQVDYTNLYLSKIRIKTYMNLSLQRDYATLKEIVKDINDPKINNDIFYLREKISSNVKKSNELRNNMNEEDIKDTYKDIEKLVNNYLDKEKKLYKLGEQRNNIQNLIYFKKNNAVLDIAFDNSQIMNIINRAINEGRIYIDNDIINIDINNKDMGMNIFHALIPIDDLLYLVECTNEDMNIITKSLAS